MQDDRQKYEFLRRSFARMARLSSLSGALQWDSATVMPAGASKARGEQLALVATLIAETLSAPALLEAVDIDEASLTPDEAANLREMRRHITHANAAPHLAGKYAVASATCEAAWRTARKDDDFKAVAPYLSEVISLARDIGAAKADAFRCTAHEATMDYWEPGVRDVAIAPLFDELAETLPNIARQTMEQQTEPAPALLAVPVDVQRVMCRRLAEMLGYDFNHGRIDESAQAMFTDDSPEDVRITTTYDETDFRRGVFGIAHEIGHSFYERAVPEAWLYQPAGRPRSAAWQESQSLLFEKFIVPSEAFIRVLGPELRAIAKTDGAAWSNAALHHQLKRVDLGPIRAGADEITYPLHVIVRYGLERDLFDGSLSVHDIPDAWRAEYQNVLGITPMTDKDGCLQDIHWHRGLFGYFQSYLLGALTAAQVLSAARNSDDAIEASLNNGDVRPLKTWLTDNIYKHGCLQTSDKLMKTATGAPLTKTAYVNYLKDAYLKD